MKKSRLSNVFFLQGLSYLMFIAKDELKQQNNYHGRNETKHGIKRNGVDKNKRKTVERKIGKTMQKH